MTIQGLHHAAYRCRDSEQTRTFYEDFEAPDMPFEFKPQHDYDLPIALQVDRTTLEAMLEGGRSPGTETRGIVDHGMFDSLYFRDPNGYVVELACVRGGHDDAPHADQDQARAQLDRWTAARRAGQPR